MLGSGAPFHFTCIHRMVPLRGPLFLLTNAYMIVKCAPRRSLPIESLLQVFHFGLPSKFWPVLTLSFRDLTTQGGTAGSHDSVGFGCSAIFKFKYFMNLCSQASVIRKHNAINLHESGSDVCINIFIYYKMCQDIFVCTVLKTITKHFEFKWLSQVLSICSSCWIQCL